MHDGDSAGARVKCYSRMLQESSRRLITRNRVNSTDRPSISMTAHARHEQMLWSPFKDSQFDQILSVLSIAIKSSTNERLCFLDLADVRSLIQEDAGHVVLRAVQHVANQFLLSASRQLSR